LSNGKSGLEKLIRVQAGGDDVANLEGDDDSQELEVGFGFLLFGDPMPA
jgi:hypothetical protein